MKRIIVFGTSVVNPYYFNNRVLQIEKVPDEYYFGNILGKMMGIDDVQSFALNGSGNEWIGSAVIDQLDQIDKDTLVIVSWSPVDRYDLVLGNEQNYFQDTIASSIYEQWKHLGFNKTYDASGNEKPSGLRYWLTAHFFFAPKIKIKSFYSHIVQLKHYYEKISLIQNLLDKKGCKHIHFNVVNPVTNTFKGLVKAMIEEWKVENPDPLYKVVKFEEEFPDTMKEYPEIARWEKIINSDLFAENSFEFYVKHNIPYACIDKLNTYHQPPINQYVYIKKAIIEKFNLPDTGVDLLEEMKTATEKHCRRYNSIYEYDEQNILKALK